MTMNAGINYGFITNCDLETGIRFGVMPQSYVLQAWADSSEGDYGDPTCPRCGSLAAEIADDEVYEQDWYDSTADYHCPCCKYCFWSEDAFGDEPLGFEYHDEEYRCYAGEDGDIFIIKSPYYTYAQFASPCAPGACYLPNTFGNRRHCSLSGDAYRQAAEAFGFPRVYCFGFDWLDDDNDEITPYRIFRVDNDEEILRNET